MALLVVAVGAIALAIVESESRRGTRTQLASAAGTGAIALVAFIVWAKTCATHWSISASSAIAPTVR
jgi:hypothetical protein